MFWVLIDYFGELRTIKALKIEFDACFVMIRSKDIANREISPLLLDINSNYVLIPISQIVYIESFTEEN